MKQKSGGEREGMVGPIAQAGMDGVSSKDHDPC